MYCTDCGEEIPDAEEVSFCPSCGTNLNQQEGDSTESNTPNESAMHEARSSQASSTHQGTSQILNDRIGAWGITRLGALVGGGLAVVGAFLPWVTAAGEKFSENAMATEFGTPVLIAGGVVIVLSAVKWGRGIGWATMLVSGLIGGGLAYIGVAAQSMLSRTVSLGTISVRGTEVPISAVNPGIGVTVVMIAGGIIVVASLLGIIGSFTGTSS